METNLLQFRFKPSANAMSQIIDDELILLDLSSGTYFELNRVGTHFWRLLENGLTAFDAIATTYDLYDVSYEQIESDLCNLLDQLLKRHLLVKT